MTNDQEYLPIHYLNALEYCPRRFYYEYVLAEMLENEHVLEGRLRHERADTPQTEREGDRLVHRRVYLYSDRLRLVGFADVVEEADGQLIPVEYKKGRMGRWLNDRVQLCAQALCLEERSGQPVPFGYLFYFGSGRRERVSFTPELRARTEAAIARAFALAREPTIPPPIDQAAKCRDCSLEPLCLPAEVQQLRSAR